MKCQSLFSGRNNKISFCLVLEFVQRVVMVKMQKNIAIKLFAIMLLF